VPHSDLLAAALAEARRSYDAGGMPIGAAIAAPSGEVVMGGHNRMLFPSGGIASHAELNAMRDLDLADLAGFSMLTTMPPCWMCGGAVRHFRLSRLYVVRQPFDSGAAAWLDADDAATVDVERVENPEAVELFERWRAEHPELWPNPRLDTW
jgi:cytosine/creatinine deaminase